jgi:hypothetical protein
VVLSIINRGGYTYVGFLTWKEAVAAAVLILLLILFLVLRDR